MKNKTYINRIAALKFRKKVNGVITKNIESVIKRHDRHSLISEKITYNISWS